MSTKIDYQRIVEEIQNAIAYDALMPDSTVNELAADYSVACEEANQRLRECVDLLRRGLRGEAIQRCEIDPNLLDLVAVLDFPERAAWCDWLRQSGRAAPPALSMDAAAELNVGYAVDQPLTGLMKRHRLLALARSPLRDRITVLQQIAAADAANPLWGDELRGYERHRHKQLQAEIDAAVRTGDVSSLTSLEHELRESVWTDRPPAPLLDRVAGQATRLRAQQARAELTQLEPELNAAFSDFDVDRARRLRGRWKACEMLAALPESDPLNEMVLPALDWLDEQDRRDHADADNAQALADLECGLDENQSRHDLDRFYHRLVSCERGVPEVLQRRFHERMAALALADSRRNKLLFAGLAVAALLAAGGIRLWIARQLRETEVAEAAKSLHGLLDEAKVAEAQEFLDGIGQDRHWLKERPEIDELHARLDGMVKSETDRREGFAAAISAAEAAGVDRPDRAQLDEARRLAESSKEKAEVLKFERMIATRQREAQDEKNAAFNARVDEIRVQMEELEGDHAEDLQQRSETIKRLEREAARLIVGDAGGAEAALVHNAKALHTRLVAMVDTANQQIDQMRGMNEISASVGNRSRFRSRLGEYIKRFPGSKRSADFQKVLDSNPSLDDQVEKWNALTAEFSKLDIQHITPEAASARIAEASVLANDWRNDPQSQLIRARVAALEPIARRVAGGARLDAQLKELFRLPTISGLKMVKTNEKGSYYVEAEPKPIGKALQVTFVKDFKLSKENAYLQEQDLPAKNAIVEAPQSVVGHKVLTELQHLADSHWEAAFCRMVDAVRDSPDLDPILKAQLLLQVLSVARTGSLALDHAYAKHFQELNDSAPDGTVNWLDPNDKRAPKARAAAKELLDGLPDFHTAREAAVKEYSSLRKPWPAVQYRWVGVLSLAEDGTWKCASQPLPEDWTSDLVLLSQTGEPPTIEVRKIGSAAKGHAVVNADGADLIEGWPVYASFVSHQLTLQR